MAVVLTARTTTFNRVPFIKPPDMQRMFTAMPRALVNSTLELSAIPAKPINDQQNVQVICVLPTQFAYRMISANIMVEQDVANAWGPGAELQLTGGIRGELSSFTAHHPMITATESFTFSTSVPQNHWTFPRGALPTYIIQGFGPGFAPIIDFRMTNVSAPAGAAGSVSALVRWYEFDIEQVQMFPPLVPGALTYDVGP